MPELPEVETIVRSLRTPQNLTDAQKQEAGVVGRTILHASVLWPRSIAAPSEGDFTSLIAGQQITAIGRRGKFLHFTLSRQHLLIHLRMSGDILLESAESTRDTKHDRVVFHLDDGNRMAFNDTRKFGRVWLVDDPCEVTCSLGPEPLDETLTAEEFYARLHKNKRTIKPLLLDQTFIAGLGNIYTDECLFAAGIHPQSRASALDQQQAAVLLASIRQVLLEGIKRNGASIDWVYRGGDFQNHFQVYQRDGKTCYRCGAIIQRTTLGQRGTHFCPHCQSLTA